MAGARRAEEAQYEVVDGKAIIIDPGGSELVRLNRLGTLVWESLDGDRDVESLTGELVGRFPSVPRQEIDADVRGFLNDLKHLKLVLGC